MSVSRSAPMSAVRFRTVFPPALVLAAAVGYIGIGFWVEEVSEFVPGAVSPFVHAGLVALQALILLLRRRSPVGVFAGVVLVDLVILASAAGELGVGSLAVMIASYSVARHTSRRTAWTALGAGAVATTVIGGGALLLESGAPLLVIVFTAVARIAFLYAIPAVVAEYFRGRERLAAALKDQARMAENERRDRAELEVRAERTALARELHDIAGHHLSGIIVSAQAAAALTMSDPERARTMMQTVQDDARITLTDLRRTVGLLRSDDDDRGPAERPRPVPSIAALPALIDAARDRGQRVSYELTGETRGLGPLGETSAYRMVQESLANAARHAPGAECHVRVAFGPDAVELTVSNEAAPLATRPAGAEVGSGDGYGLAGMTERAELIGAQLTTGPTAGGGWTNRLAIPLDERNIA
ncbi:MULTISPECIES: sensor histidine kinase [unclassified Microbacterium]|uniref:sensor histidine kinase n=1 Tax=unclassified Microbacterium TaxID=2609290 RepID=UPI000EA8F35D|nr:MULTISPECIES: histidine kinase [unclassified Microbacterium]MBT2484688.1 hypothetical protein [Microbacterium sp. ISL-108]RKN67575.1 histidine kinase [Microbacterium sp. CGR2]